jgi:hypothetical protein
MTKHDEEFLDVYETYRFRDQQVWYRNRREEFNEAHNQVTALIAVLMFLAAVSAALTAFNVARLRGLWAVLAVAFPALSTAFAAYRELYSFERHARVYRDSENALIRVDAYNPRHRPGIASEIGYRRALSTYVSKGEAVLRKEQGQWGQLISEIHRIEIEPIYADETPEDES